MRFGTAALLTRGHLMKSISEGTAQSKGSHGSLDACSCTIFALQASLHLDIIREYPTPGSVHLAVKRHHLNIADFSKAFHESKAILATMTIAHSRSKHSCRLCQWNWLGLLCTRTSLSGSFAFDAMFYNPGVLLHVAERNPFLRVEDE